MTVNIDSIAKSVNMSLMESRDIHIVQAAMRLFLRFGVKRTSMNDIAGEAGISRQTLYKSFANKDAVLKGLIRFLADKVVQDIETGLQKAEGLAAQLDVVFDHVVIEHFDVLQTSPNAEDFIAGINAASEQELETGAQRNTQIIARLLEPFAGQIAAAGLSVAQYADFVQRTAHAHKYVAKNRKHLLALLGALQVSVLRVTGESA